MPTLNYVYNLTLYRLLTSKNFYHTCEANNIDLFREEPGSSYGPLFLGIRFEYAVVTHTKVKEKKGEKSRDGRLKLLSKYS